MSSLPSGVPVVSSCLLCGLSPDLTQHTPASAARGGVQQPPLTDSSGLPHWNLPTGKSLKLNIQQSQIHGTRGLRHQQGQGTPAVHNHRPCSSREAPARKHRQIPVPRGFMVTSKDGTAGLAPLQLSGLCICAGKPGVIHWIPWNLHGGCLQLSKGRGSCSRLGISSLLVFLSLKFL